MKKIIYILTSYIVTNNQFMFTEELKTKRVFSVVAENKIVGAMSSTQIWLSKFAYAVKPLIWAPLLVKRHYRGRVEN